MDYNAKNVYACQLSIDCLIVSNIFLVISQISFKFQSSTYIKQFYFQSHWFLTQPYTEGWCQKHYHAIHVMLKTAAYARSIQSLIDIISS